MSSEAVTTGSGELEELLARVERDLATDILPVDVFNDEAVFRAEIERIFTRSWVFLAHESEIANAGDFVQRRIGVDPVIVTRDGEGKIHALSNYCRHRGTQVCQTDQGNSRFFQCPYHGWTYSNTGELVGTPFMHKAYGGRVDPAAWSLLRAPHVESRNGFIFATLSQDAPSLTEFLGGGGWMLDAMTALHPDGMRVVGPPDRFHIKADWKSGADNFSGDTYHVPTLHGSMSEIGKAPSLDMGMEFGRPYEFDGGHTFAGIAWTQINPYFTFWGYAPEVKDRFDLSHLDEAQRQVAEHDGPIVGTLFPNLSFFRGPSAALDDSGEMLTPTSIRQWQPVGPGELEVWSWQLAWSFQSQEEAERYAVIGQQSFGSAGIAEQDDTVAWEGAAQAGASPWARKAGLVFHYRQGTGSELEAPDPTWTGPGIRRLTGYGENNQPNWWRAWLAAMQADGGLGA